MQGRLRGIAKLTGHIVRLGRLTPKSATDSRLTLTVRFTLASLMRIGRSDLMRRPDCESEGRASSSL
jgi:hypothetical protein